MTAAEPASAAATRVGAFYDLMGEFLTGVYGANIHYGWWDSDDDPATLDQAQERLNDLIAERLQVGAGHQVLDIGCGTGGPARRVATVTGAQVLGVSISAWQVQRATDSTPAHLASQVGYRYADATELPLPDGSFDAAMALETLVHIADKPAALREALRVLRPGGRLVITDLTERTAMTGAQRAAWAAMPVAPAGTTQSYVDELRTVGFDVVEVLDATGQIGRSFTAIRGALERPDPAAARRYGARMLEQMRAGIAALMAVSADCLGYTLLTAVKPG
jgi:ubiquinone/menaquinone biosynthesis C-methylase UbiE